MDGNWVSSTLIEICLLLTNREITKPPHFEGAGRFFLLNNDILLIWDNIQIYVETGPERGDLSNDVFLEKKSR